MRQDLVEGAVRPTRRARSQERTRGATARMTEGTARSGSDDQGVEEGTRMKDTKRDGTAGAVPGVGGAGVEAGGGEVEAGAEGTMRRTGGGVAAGADAGAGVESGGEVGATAGTGATEEGARAAVEIGATGGGGRRPRRGEKTGGGTTGMGRRVRRAPHCLRFRRPQRP